MVESGNGQVSEVVSLAEGAELMAALAGAARAREAAVRLVVERLAAVDAAGVVESLEGLPLDVWLSVGLGWTAAERRMLLDAGGVLAVMPGLWSCWQRGVVSWAVVREVVVRVRRLGREGRAAVDARLAASEGLLGDMDPDQVCWAVEAAVDAVRGVEAKVAEEAGAEREAFLAVQPDVFGGAWVSGYLDPVGTAVATGGLDRRADRDVAGGGSLGSTAKDRARALVGVCADELASHDEWTYDDPEGDLQGNGPDGHEGSDGQVGRGVAADPGDGRVGDGRGARGTAGGGRVVHRAARPLLVVHVPLDRVTETAAGLLEVAVPGSLPRLSAALVENLAADAQVRAVLFEGARPLHVTAKTDAAGVPADTRLAVTARDLGGRDPAARTPVPLAQVHHLSPGLHHPDHLVTISPRGHGRVVHRWGWSGRVDVDTGVVSWTRQGRTIRTLPWGTHLHQPTPEPDPGPQPDGDPTGSRQPG